MRPQGLPLLHDGRIVGKIDRAVKSFFSSHQIVRLHQADSASGPRVPIIGEFAVDFIKHWHCLVAAAVVCDQERGTNPTDPDRILSWAANSSPIASQNVPVGFSTRWTALIQLPDQSRYS